MKRENVEMLNTVKLVVVSFLFGIFRFGKMAFIRNALLRWAGAKVGKNVNIMPSAKFIGNYKLVIGDNCFIGNEVLFMGSKNSTIMLSDNVTISSRVTMTTGTHRFSWDGKEVIKEGYGKDITIMEGSGVLMCCTILPGVTINKMSLIAAGSVVTKEVPEFCLVGGSPAKIIRDMRIEKSSQ